MICGYPCDIGEEGLRTYFFSNDPCDAICTNACQGQSNELFREIAVLFYFNSGPAVRTALFFQPTNRIEQLSFFKYLKGIP